MKRWFVVVAQNSSSKQVNLIMTSKLQKVLSFRRLSSLLRPHSPSSSSSPSTSFRSLALVETFRILPSHSSTPILPCRTFFSSRYLGFNASATVDSQSPAPIDYRSLLSEDEFHSRADSTIHDLQEKLEEYGDEVQIDGFDIDYGNDVLTLKLGDLGTYVLNKQTPNRQLWLSSPVSGPSRFDWDQNAQSWIYRRTKAHLLEVFESELKQLCGEPIKLS